MPINSFLYPAPTNSNPYEVANSLRFDGASSDYLEQTLPNNDASIDKWTYSGWIKKNSNGVETYLFHFWTDGSNRGGLRFNSDDTLFYYDRIGGTDIVRLKTNAVFRDPSAWYHIVVKVDKSVSTPNTQIYVNGIEQSLAEDSDYTQGEDGKINEAITLYINNYDGSQNIRTIMMSEVCWISGTAYDPTSFGEFDNDTNIWKPKEVLTQLDFGTNGFYLDFEDSSALGNDVSGNNNDFTVNNLTSIDQTTDTCTNNFCTLNPLDFGSGSISNTSLSEGNLKFVSTQGGSPYPYYISTMAVSEGKWYAEFKFVSSDSGTAGIGNGVADQYAGNNAYDYSYYFDGRLYNSGSGESTGYSAISNNDILGCALDLDNNKIYFHINGTYQASGDPSAGTGGKSITASASNGTGFYHFEVGDAGANQPTIECNFGNPSFSISSGNSDGNGYGNFEYSVPSGYYALCTKNLAEYG